MGTIQVYGPGCTKCTQLALITEEAMKELEIDIPLEKVTDILQFSLAGILVTPALVIDGEILISGKVPSKESIKKILQNTCNQQKISSTSTLKDESQPAALTQEPCCKGNKKQSNSLKKILLWFTAILILLAIVKTVNHKNKEDNEKNSDQAPALQTALKNQSDHIEIVYYQYGARCVTCVRMEKWAKEAIEQSFPDELKQGSLIFQSIPAKQSSVEKYKLTSKSLVVKEVQNHKETKWNNLKQIWNLNNDEQAFKTYVVECIQKALSKLP